jgi:hypothetical protein
MRRQRSDAAPWTEAPDPLLALARAELAFYEEVRDSSRRWHRITEFGALAASSSTVVAAGLRAPAWLTALVAGAALFFTGFRQVFAHGPRYVLAAQSREGLRRALNRYQLLAVPDRHDAAREDLLAAIENVGAEELRQWSDQRHHASPSAGTSTGTTPNGPALP